MARVSVEFYHKAYDLVEFRSGKFGYKQRFAERFIDPMKTNKTEGLCLTENSREAGATREILEEAVQAAQAFIDAGEYTFVED